MLSSFLATVTCLAIPVADPLETPAVMSEGPAVEVGIYVTPTTFRGRNFSDATQLLVFTTAGSPDPVVVQLLPGGIAAYKFSPEGLAGVVLEVVAKRDNHLTTSGAHSLCLPSGAVDMSLWTVPGAPRGTTWQQVGCQVTDLPSDKSCMPPGSLWDAPDSGSASVTHVPVTVPRVLIGPGILGDDYTPM